MAKRISSDEDPAEEDLLIRRALWAAAVIAYRRGFTGGRSLIGKGQPRRKIPDALMDSLSEELQKAHNEVLDMADKHFAHRVSDLEQIQVVLMLAPPPNPRAVIGAGHLMVKFVGPAPELLDQLSELAEMFEGTLQTEVAVLNQSLLDESQPHAEALYASTKVLPTSSTS